MKSLKLVAVSGLILTASAVFGTMQAQQVSANAAKVVVKGTSPMHDWEMTSSAATFTGTVSGNALTNVKFVMPAKNLKSTKGKMMDNKAYGALKADRNPNIYFAAASLPVGKSNVSGKMTIAGVTRTVSVPVSVTKSGSSYIIVANDNMKMSEYGMETPGFLGVHTGDAVSVSVNLTAN